MRRSKVQALWFIVPEQLWPRGADRTASDVIHEDFGHCAEDGQCDLLVPEMSESKGAVVASTYGVRLTKSDRLPLPTHEDHCTVAAFDEWVSRHAGERLAVDLFTGAGGLSLGIQEAGWTIAAGIDFDERALETHAHNFSGLSLRLDLGDPDVRDELVATLQKAPIDLIAGGPPCQPFSRAGRNKIRDLVRNHGRDPEDLRKTLWQAYLDVVTRVRPRAVLMENVPDMGLADDFAVVRIIQEKLEELGYATEVRLASAWKFGVPQHRKRLILLARNDVDTFAWPEELAEEPTLRDAISDLPALDVVPREPIGARESPYDDRAERSMFAQRMREGAPAGAVYDHMTRAVRADDHEIFDAMTSKTLYSEVPEHLRRYRADNFTDKYKRLGWDELSRTITAHIAKDGYWYIHPGEPRTLTVREAARVQTFPDRFRFAGTRSDAFRQIGNAVPPMLGHAAASALAPTDMSPTDRAGAVTPKWRLIRDELARWAASDRDGDNWFLYPGPDVGPAQAAVVALLTGQRLSDIRQVLERLRGRKWIKPDVYKELLASAPTPGAQRRLLRLQSAVETAGIWNPDRVHDLAGLLNLKPAEESMFSLLVADRDLLLMSQSTLRVAARVAGTDSDKNNRGTEGRVDLSRLVGAGEDAATRMAAIQVIGRTLCTAEQPACAGCPLRDACESRRDEEQLTLLSAADPSVANV